MKLKNVLLRWYKSFHLNYRRISEKGETTAYRPWNKMSPSYAAGDEFPFIEIPVEPDVTTIVGANESGKSHLLNAISKVVCGSGIDGDNDFKRPDMCHYARVRTRTSASLPRPSITTDVPPLLSRSSRQVSHCRASFPQMRRGG